ncbi:MAG: hypothetical protein Q8O67_04890 [Deltaproteobacteria bacterium]|nr:hypothetical protein [Deltaproteobacteria bacterium]
MPSPPPLYREELTRQVRAAESGLIDLLDELSAADDAAAVDDAAGAVRFPLEVLKSERARLGAEGDARRAARVVVEAGG